MPAIQSTVSNDHSLQRSRTDLATEFVRQFYEFDSANKGLTINNIFYHMVDGKINFAKTK